MLAMSVTSVTSFCGVHCANWLFSHTYTTGSFHTAPMLMFS